MGARTALSHMPALAGGGWCRLAYWGHMVTREKTQWVAVRYEVFYVHHL